jgi:hypothetical protein
MSQNLAPVVAKIREAVRGAHANFRSLYEAADRDSIPVSLLLAGSTLDKLTYNLDLLATSSAALSSNYVRALFDTRMAADVKLSDAITRDMDVVASCLRLMMPSNSSEPVMIMEEHQCRNVADMVDRYDRTISSTLIQYNVYVQTSTATSLYHSPLYRSSLDVLVEGTHSLLGGMDDIRNRLREQQESVVAELRESMT